MHSVAFLRNKAFDPRRPGWSQVCARLLKLHALLVAGAAEQAAPLLSAGLASLGAPPAMAAAYLALLTLPPRARKESGARFFAEFTVFRNTLE
jgi:hypothetical protein